MRETFLPFAKPTISEEAIAEVVTCLRSGWITTGPRVQAFEEDLKRYTGAPHALTVMSATTGLYFALLAMGVGPGDEVITTPLTFAATLNVIDLVGATPVLVDVDPGTLNMDISLVASKITPRTKVIMPVHFAGLPVDLDPLYALAKAHGLRVIEDAAHAIGAQYKGRKIGSFGDTQVFSFHPNKNMTTIEGGAITTTDPEVARQIELLRFHGIDRPAWNRFQKKGSQHYDVVVAGHKSNMTDVQAALGISQLKAVDSFNERRASLAEGYKDALKDMEALQLPSSPSYDAFHCWHLFTPILKKEGRDDLLIKLKENYNIGTGLHYLPVHLYSHYQKKFGFKEGDFPEAEKIGRGIFSLPLFPTMSDQDQQDVVTALKDILS